MTARDDLAALINGGPLSENPRTVGGIYAIHEAYERADAILAAGYSKPKPPTVTPPHDIDVERAPYCTVCGRDVRWNDDTEAWEH